jgi:hypothetical protein
MLTCLFDPLGCVGIAVGRIPTDVWIVAALFIGLLLGATFRWAAVALASFFALLFFRRKEIEENLTEVTGKDALPPVTIRKGKRLGR